MIKYLTILFSLSVFVNGCRNNSTILGNSNDDYERYKKTFDLNFVSHFPDKIVSEKNFIICNTNSEKNDVGMFLIENGLIDLELKKIEKKAIKLSVKVYKVSDSCLFIVNRFETEKTKKEFEVPELSDSTIIEKQCYKKLLPIPNFIEYSINYKTNFWNDKDFNIYVFDAKPGIYLDKFDLEPDAQMPKDWKNGYSKGIAINKKNKTIIYWGIIW